MRGLHLGLSDLEGFLVGLLRVVQHSCSLVTNSHLGKVPVVITFHLQIKHLGLGIAGFGNKVLVQKVLKFNIKYISKFQTGSSNLRLPHNSALFFSVIAKMKFIIFLW